MVEDPLALERQVCFALATASRSVIKLYRPVLEPLGLTHPQYLVMLALWERSPRSLRDIADALLLEPPHPDAAAEAPGGDRLPRAGTQPRRRARAAGRADPGGPRPSDARPSRSPFASPSSSGCPRTSSRRRGGRSKPWSAHRSPRPPTGGARPPSAGRPCTDRVPPTDDADGGAVAVRGDRRARLHAARRTAGRRGSRGWNAPPAPTRRRSRRTTLCSSAGPRSCRRSGGATGSRRCSGRRSPAWTMSRVDDVLQALAAEDIAGWVARAPSATGPRAPHDLWVASLRLDAAQDVLMRVLSAPARP